MADEVGAWAGRLKATWMQSLKSLRLGNFGTSELRNGRRTDTTLETIAERKKDLAELETVIVRHDADEELKESLQRDVADRQKH